MMYPVEFRPYTRQFKQPLITKHGVWRFRRGIILRLTCHGQVGLGEIAPLEWFGTESFAQVLDFCNQLAPEITAEQIFSVPAELPACQFGLESAWEALKYKASSLDCLNEAVDHLPQLPLCGLLPTGEAALSAWQALWKQGYRSFKWKIGVAPMPTEIANFQRLIQDLPPAAKLRIDANGGLSYEETEQWLRIFDSKGIEFLEQPLPEDQLDAMVKLSRKYKTPIALDESVATLPQLQACYDQGWQGIFVIKPAIAGSLRQLRKFCQQPSVQAVFSSVFETAIGRQAALKLAAELSSPGYAIGFGTHHWFKDDLNTDADEDLCSL